MATKPKEVKKVVWHHVHVSPAAHKALKALARKGKVSVAVIVDRLLRAK